jgi:predicted O-methyltransferase YrrM
MNLLKFMTWLNTNAFVTPSEKIQDVCTTVGGFSAPAIMQILSGAIACLAEDELYLEIGSYQGRSLCGALVDNPQARAVAVDNFSEFTQADAPTILAANLARYNLTAQVQFYQEDTQAFLNGHTELHGRVGVYFYDGNHNTDQGLAALENALPLLAERAVIIVDDFSGIGIWRTVQQFTERHHDHAQMIFAIATPNFPFPAPNWHNGVVVLAYQKHAQHLSLIT